MHMYMYTGSDADSDDDDDGNGGKRTANKKRSELSLTRINIVCGMAL